ncbi:MAG TPA: hypothetical protein VLT62_15160 [Candidatus Methylomirabilis sp.]|nr:hypothetical protein [Candidatus Methylomirabilis sp.]
MRYRFLGSCGLRSSRITRGTMTLGAPDRGCDEQGAHAILTTFLDAGGNPTVATDDYAGGRAELPWPPSGSAGMPGRETFPPSGSVVRAS